jgi:hypothetical protein
VSFLERAVQALVPAAVVPDDLVSEAQVTKHFLQDEFGCVADVPVEMYIYRAAIGERFAEQDQPLVKHLQVALDAHAPGVAVGLLLDHRRDLDQFLIGSSTFVTNGDP